MKLFTDTTAAVVALYYLWQHNPFIGLVVALGPSVIVSLVIMRCADLERYKRSSFGKDVNEYMTNLPQSLRLIGFVVVAIGAWYRVPWLIFLGLFVILLCRFRGIIPRGAA